MTTKRAKSLSATVKFLSPQQTTLDEVLSGIHRMERFLQTCINGIREDAKANAELFKLTIQSQNESIKAQNESIKTQHESIKAQNESIKAQNMNLELQMKEIQKHGRAIEILLERISPNQTTEEKEEVKATKPKQASPNPLPHLCLKKKKKKKSNDYLVLQRTHTGQY
eukprot:TRINITY_DN1386_c0_g1_i5.p2 TRINITY_DN1386_c0_g1~~TRINITY_DN1386_c0_g1_i5.p2  ORF type:complete len:168 (-),score=16.79 TRINITY_DN1386_c0_g1_i5:52-555(-)